MKKKISAIFAIMTVVVLMLSSFVSLASISPDETDSPIQTPEVQDGDPNWNNAPIWWDYYEDDSVFSKKIWNNNIQDWDETGTFLVGEQIQYKISFTVDAANTYQSRWYNVEIVDHLPPTVRYISSSITPDEGPTPEVFFDSTTDSYFAFNRLYWNLGNLMDGDHVEIIITGEVEYLTKLDFGIHDSQCPYPINYHSRNVAIMDYNWRSTGCGNYHYHETVNNDATFTILYCGDPDIQIQKTAIYNNPWQSSDEIDPNKETCPEGGSYFTPQLDTSQFPVTVHFKINVTNTGEVPLFVVVEDTLPNGLIYDNNANPAPYEINGNKITWKLGTMYPGQTFYISFDALVMTCGIYKNIANATGSTIQQEFVYDEDSATVRIPCEPEVEIEKQVWDGCIWSEYAEVNIGDTVTFKITVNNPNDYPMHFSGYIFDKLPNNLQYVAGSATIDATETINWVENTVNWTDIDTLEAGKSIIFTFNATAIDCGLGTNYAKVHAYIIIDEEAPNHKRIVVEDSDDASVYVECPPPQANMTLEKYVKWDCQTPYTKYVEAEIGDYVMFKLYINNTGETPLDITVIDELPTGLTYADNANIPPDNINGNILTWYFTDIAAQTSIEITFKADVDDCGELINVANATATYQQQSIYHQDMATVKVDCVPANPDISLKKYVKEAPCGQYNDTGVTVEAGEDVTFKLVVTNTGDVNLSSVTVCDTLPLHLVYADNAMVDGIPTEPYNSGNSLCWDLGTITVGQIVEITFDAVTDEDFCGIYENIAIATGNYDCTIVDDEDDATVTVPCPPQQANMTLEKYVKWDCQTPYTKYVEAEIGGYVMFKLYINNTGETPLDITVIDELPTGLTYADNANIPPDNINGNILTWYFTDIAAQTSIEITFKADVDDCGELINVANATATYQQQSIYHQDMATVSVPCPDEPDVDIEKLVKPYCEGEWSDYLEVELEEESKVKIIVENTGETPLNITVLDVLPSNLQYIGDSANYVPDINGNELTWNFSDVQPNDPPIVIIFGVKAVDCGEADNWAYVTTDMQVSDEDNATINVICEDEWDHSSIEVTGKCVEGNAVFTITNTGEAGEGDMDGPSEYRVYRNDVLEDTANFQLAGQENMTVTVTANGDTIRLEADQRPGHPGSSQPQATVEDCGCGDDTDGDDDPEEDTRDKSFDGSRIRSLILKFKESKNIQNLLAKIFNKFQKLNYIFGL